jgi:hypothetical protein
VPIAFEVFFYLYIESDMIEHSHLSDPSHRETFESAHSVMLAILAAHTQKAGQPSPSFSQTTENDKRPQAFAEQAVPFYTQCLIDVCPHSFVLATYSNPLCDRIHLQTS